MSCRPMYMRHTGTPAATTRVITCSTKAVGVGTSRPFSASQLPTGAKRSAVIAVSPPSCWRHHVGCSVAVSRALQNHHRSHGFFHADEAAAVLGQCNFRTLDLTRPGLAAKLCREFGQHREPGRADGMALRHETARRVD